MDFTVFLILSLFFCNTFAQLNLGLTNGLDLGLNLLGNPKRTTTVRPTGSRKPVVSFEPPKSCIPPKTKLATSTRLCKGDLFFSDDFSTPFLRKDLWNIEQYIPSIEGPDFEFVSYENNDEVLFNRNGNLIFNPKVREEFEIRGQLDLRDKCTSNLPSECYYEQISNQIIPPVRSAKISAKLGFTYGRIEIKAKLPQGDWIYSQIQLVPRNKSPLKFWIAYSRGNNHFIGNQDEGSSLLFGGIIVGNQPQDRIKFTKTRRNLVPYGNQTHTYTLIWEPNFITLLFDNEQYDRFPIDEEDERFYPLRREFHLTLGVGVGGINDFPDYYTSNPKKPWVNMDRKQMKDFYDAKSEWFETWYGGKSEMEIDSVKIYAV